MKTVLEAIREDTKEGEQPWRAMAAVYAIEARICKMELADALEHRAAGRNDLADKTVKRVLGRLLEIQEADEVLYREGMRKETT